MLDADSFGAEKRSAASLWLSGVNSRPASPPPPPVLKRTSGVGAHHGARKSCLLCETRTSSRLQISPKLPPYPLTQTLSGPHIQVSCCDPQTLVLLLLLL